MKNLNEYQLQQLILEEEFKYWNDHKEECSETYFKELQERIRRMKANLIAIDIKAQFLLS